mmetsp:Transcript_46822/g.119452  ORF Transcript_46822/g.119452 Transcript_46822/m.119452 type:complete len:232 (-) Transcript_46822:31-726(-)
MVPSFSGHVASEISLPSNRRWAVVLHSVGTRRRTVQTHMPLVLQRCSSSTGEVVLIACDACDWYHRRRLHDAHRHRIHSGPWPYVRCGSGCVMVGRIVGRKAFGWRGHLAGKADMYFINAGPPAVAGMLAMLPRGVRRLVVVTPPQRHTSRCRLRSVQVYDARRHLMAWLLMLLRRAIGQRLLVGDARVLRVRVDRRLLQSGADRRHVDLKAVLHDRGGPSWPAGLSCGRH